MDHKEFYKEQYAETLSQKSEINNSLSTPIGILTALIAGFFYALTNFDFTDNVALSFIFCVASLLSIGFLYCAVRYLTLAFSDLHNGFEYAYLNDANILKEYYDGLLNYYSSQSDSTPEASLSLADKDFCSYLLKEYIKSAGINQRNNDSKITYRFQCQRYIIFALISLTLLTVPFGIDVVITKTKDKIQKVEVNSPISISRMDTTDKEVLNLIKIMAKQQIQKPTPPPTKMVREGVNPNSNVNRPKSTEGGKQGN